MYRYHTYANIYIYIYAYKIRKAIDNLLVKENIVHKEIHFYNIKK